MAASFSPVEEVLMYCRHCKKTLPAQLERSIAGSGRTVDRESTFEYFCTKCHKTTCFAGTDLLESSEEEVEPRQYSAKDHFFVGEIIHHPSFEETGTVVWKEPGSPTRIVVQFEKSGVKKLVEDI